MWVDRKPRLKYNGAAPFQRVHVVSLSHAPRPPSMLLPLTFVLTSSIALVD